MILKTDTAARRVEFIWLGPAGTPWPFEARGKVWVLAVLLTPPLAVAAGSTLDLLAGYWITGPGPTLAWLTAALALGIILSVLLTRKVARHLTPSTSLAHLVTLAEAITTSPRQPTPTTHETTVPATLHVETRDVTTHVTTVSALTFQEDR